MAKKKLTKTELLNRVPPPVIKNLKKEEIYKYLAPNLSIEERDAAFFSLLFTNKVEDLLTKSLGDVVRKFVKTEYQRRAEIVDLVSSISSELIFRSKIRVFRSITFPRYQKFLAFCDKVNNLRNDLSHGKYKNLMYGKERVADLVTQQKMIDDFHDAVATALDGAEVDD